MNRAKYEYKIIEIDGDLEYTQDTLNEWAKDGWKVASILGQGLPRTTVFFEKSIPVEFMVLQSPVKFDIPEKVEKRPWWNPRSW